MAALVWCCLLGLAPAYLVKLCDPPLLSALSSHSLRSIEQGLLHVSFAHISTRQKRAFLVVGPWIWNDLPLMLLSLLRTISQAFLSQLKMLLIDHSGV